MLLKSVIFTGNKIINICQTSKIFNVVAFRKFNQGITFTSEHDQMKSTLQKIINSDINPFVDEWEEKEIFPAHQVFKKLGEAGLLGITKPVAYGGLGLDFTFALSFYEGLSQINCGGIPMSIVVHATPALSSFGSEKLKQEFLVPSIAGERVSCIGISEPDHGSDVAGIKTNAVKKGGDLVINGGKMWTTNGCQADWMCLLANTREGPPHKNKSLICLPLNLPGVHVSKKIKKLGMKSSDTAQIFFEDVKVPVDYIIGEEGMGFYYQMIQFQDERISGIALEMKNDGQDVTFLASMGKLKAGRLTREVMDSCLQFWGGMGYTDDVLISRFYRDARLLSIGAGTDEIMLAIISKYMGILPK